MRRRVTYIETLKDGTEVELDFELVEGTLLQAKAGDQYVVAYLVSDNLGWNIDDLIGDAMGKLYSAHRDCSRDEHSKMQEALGMDNDWKRDSDIQPDPDAVVLDCYEHGGQVWSISGHGMQCRWDTTRGAGVWVPDEYLREELEKLKGDERRARALLYAKQFLDTYNAILAGEVYGCVVQTYDENGERFESDSCWGFIGFDPAMESLESEYFKPTCASVQKQYDVDVRTSCGKQPELPL